MPPGDAGRPRFHFSLLKATCQPASPVTPRESPTFSLLVASPVLPSRFRAAFISRWPQFLAMLAGLAKAASLISPLLQEAAMPHDTSQKLSHCWPPADVCSMAAAAMLHARYLIATPCFSVAASTRAGSPARRPAGAGDDAGRHDACRWLQEARYGAAGRRRARHVRSPRFEAMMAHLFHRRRDAAPGGDSLATLTIFGRLGTSAGRIYLFSPSLAPRPCRQNARRRAVNTGHFSRQQFSLRALLRHGAGASSAQLGDSSLGTRSGKILLILHALRRAAVVAGRFLGR